MLYDDRCGCGGWYSPHKVEAHGWVSIFGSCTHSFAKCNEEKRNACDDLRVTVHDSNGNEKYSGAPDFNQNACNW